MWKEFHQPAFGAREAWASGWCGTDRLETLRYDWSNSTSRRDPYLCERFYLYYATSLSTIPRSVGTVVACSALHSLSASFLIHRSSSWGSLVLLLQSISSFDGVRSISWRTLIPLTLLWEISRFAISKWAQTTWSQWYVYLLDGLYPHAPLMLMGPSYMYSWPHQTPHSPSSRSWVSLVERHLLMVCFCGPVLYILNLAHPLVHIGNKPPH